MWVEGVWGLEFVNFAVSDCEGGGGGSELSRGRGAGEYGLVVLAELEEDIAAGRV